MQTKTQDPDPQSPPEGEGARDWQGNGGKGAESALARLKQLERNRAGFRSHDAETHQAQGE